MPEPLRRTARQVHHDGAFTHELESVASIRGASEAPFTKAISRALWWCEGGSPTCTTMRGVSPFSCGMRTVAGNTLPTSGERYEVFSFCIHTDSIWIAST